MSDFPRRKKQGKDSDDSRSATSETFTRDSSRLSMSVKEMDSASKMKILKDEYKRIRDQRDSLRDLCLKQKHELKGLERQLDELRSENEESAVNAAEIGRQLEFEKYLSAESFQRNFDPTVDASQLTHAMESFYSSLKNTADLDLLNGNDTAFLAFNKDSTEHRTLLRENERLKNQNEHLSERKQYYKELAAKLQREMESLRGEYSRRP